MQHLSGSGSQPTSSVADSGSNSWWMDLQTAVVAAETRRRGPSKRAMMVQRLTKESCRCSECCWTPVYLAHVVDDFQTSWASQTTAIVMMLKIEAAEEASGRSL